MLQGFVQIFLTLFLVVISVPIAGHYLAKVFCMERTWLDPIMGVAESRYEFGCRDVAMQRLYKDFEITQNYFSYRNQQRPIMNPLERLIYLFIGIEPQKSMTGREYAIALLLSNTAMAVLALLLLMFQSLLPLNPTNVEMFKHLNRV
ncbi:MULTISPECIES: potassium-transporting ATPase subunit KdpA [unclassified Nostoc]|uniref:potassium-transporting ATPase subunit KdpA n=1 Tax=unclassified Nostoc TaxID=2593658 RepID=UPI002AD3F279|nr:potassium-transporting ATPase subunit KdpA [Nostoc sp. DedQUE03]MDZ7974805.1 potassium-transporting ATPase subunit KdpA [Nostoc sp. DedQUE03]MDZ8045012.1 potassium-transporting ATPase subunit KdpA [Nostoc sp. DedQUE02]